MRRRWQQWWTRDTIAAELVNQQLPRNEEPETKDRERKSTYALSGWAIRVGSEDKLMRKLRSSAY